MKKTYFKPYYIELNYEYLTHVNIGKDYGNHKTANLGPLSNIIWWNRKRKNSSEKRYKICNNYSEWENYVDCKFKVYSKINYKNMMHWLKMKKRHKEFELAVAKVILVPIYVAILSLSITIEQENMDRLSLEIFIIILIMTIIGVSMSVLNKCQSEI